MVMKERYSGNMIGFCRSLPPEATPDLELKCSSHSVVGGEYKRDNVLCIPVRVQSGAYVQGLSSYRSTVELRQLEH